MFCENCGAKIPDNAKFCKFCGAQQTPLDAPAPSAPAPAPAPAAVDKQALIAHLDALYAAEMGMVYADQLMAQLAEQKKEALRRHTVQYQPAYFTEKPPERRNCAAEAQEELDRWRKWYNDHVQSLSSGRTLTDRIMNSFYRIQDQKDLAEKRAQIAHWEEEVRLAPQRQALEDERWNKAMQPYNARKAQFDAREAARRDAWDEAGRAMGRRFDESIADTQRQKDEFAARRQKLYDLNVVYEKFRDPVAEFQLAEYLRMGLVNSLEGPQGGYAFYLNELHANRICGSIQELQRSMEKRLDELIDRMSGLAEQLRKANQRLHQVRSTVFDCCEALRSGFAATTDHISRMSDDVREELDRQARPIRDAVQRSEYNQYLAAMRRELDKYDYGRLRVPTLDEVH